MYRLQKTENKLREKQLKLKTCKTLFHRSDWYLKIRIMINDEIPISNKVKMPVVRRSFVNKSGAHLDLACVRRGFNGVFDK